MILLPKPYQEEYNFAMGESTVARQRIGVLLLSDRAKIEERSRLITSCAIAILTAIFLNLLNQVIFLPNFQVFTLTAKFQVFTLTAKLAIIVGSGFLYYRSRQPEYFEAKLPVAE